MLSTKELLADQLTWQEENLVNAISLSELACANPGLKQELDEVPQQPMEVKNEIEVYIIWGQVKMTIILSHQFDNALACS
jgi:hypothetical protein